MQYLIQMRRVYFLNLHDNTLTFYDKKHSKQ